jgi:hypothetical protein
VQIYLNAFLTSTLDAGEWPVSRPGKFTLLYVYIITFLSYLPWKKEKSLPSAIKF